MGSLFGRRRRVWFRVTPPEGGSPTSGSSLVEAGGLPRTEHPGFADEFAQLVAAVSADERGDRAGARRSRVMSALSDQLVTFAILAYLVAMISHAVEYALGNARRGAGEGGRPGPGAGRRRRRRRRRRPVEPPVRPRPSTRPEPLGAAGRAWPGGSPPWLTALAVALHLGALVTRGVAAERMPWGNMYEFVLTVTFIGAAAWLAVLWKQPSLRQLGLFLTLVMVLLLGVRRAEALRRRSRR